MTAGNKGTQKTGKLSDVEIFTGFKPAIEACFMDWEDYPIPGVTFGRNPKYLCPFTVFKHPSDTEDGSGRAGCGQVNSSQAVLRCEFPGVGTHRPRSGHEHRPRTQSETLGRIGEALVRSSLSSEEMPSDEGVEEAPSQSEGEGAEGGDDKFPEFIGASAIAAQKSKVLEDGEKLGDESSPERDMESDWSSGQSEAQQRIEESREPELPAPIPASDPQDYRVYFYDPKVPVSTQNEDGSKEEVDIFKNLRKIEDSWEILFMRAEGIHAHGYHSHACEMAVRLALDMLKNPPDLITDAPPISFKGKKRRACAASHQITHTASTTLTHCAFICTVLSETAQTPNHLYLAFQIGMFGLEMARPPASTKPMEVKLAHQESELVALLKRLPLGQAELAIVRERAIQLREGSLRSRGEALLPMMLSSFIFESLVLTSGSKNNFTSSRVSGDEILGFEAAVAAIGLKANVSEADHPLLCEGTRRQRGDLALMLLVNYKDDPEKLAKIMDKLLDKDIHQMCKSPLLPNYYTCRSGTNAQQQMSVNVPPPGYPANNPNQPPPQQNLANDMANLHLGARPRDRVRRASRENQQDGAAGVRRPEGASPPDWDSYKAWEAKFRCTNLRTNKPKTPGHHMASIDSSAPETASSDNSPTMVRRFRPPPSDSGSSGNSSDSSGSRLGRPRIESPSQGIVPPPQVQPNRTEQSFVSYPVPGPAVSMMEMTNLTRTTLPNIKVTRFKGKRAYPSVPNQPSEASAHFMFELAKTVLTKAGGTSTTSLFTENTSNQNPRGPQRALHMCAFQIGLYALGLHNRVSPNWISRTYSSHVSWITGQAMEIGATAIRFLIGTWEGHLTPPEAASIADRASRGRDAGIVTSAAELALSCLSQAHALNPNEIARAILQCKEQSDLMLEKACLAVEEAARGGGVYPEVMFTVARHWYELWKTRTPGTRQEDNDGRHPPTSGAECVQNMNNQLHLSQQQHQQQQLQQQQQQMAGHQIPGLPIAGNHMQVGMQFPIYSLIQGYPNSLPPQIPLQMQMYVGPPHHHMLSGIPVSTPQGGYAQFPGLGPGLANLPGLQMFPNMPDGGPRFNMAGGPLFQLALPNLQGMSMPLLPTPPTSQHIQQGVPLLPHPAPASSPMQPPGVPSPSSPANHHGVTGNVVYQRYLLSSFRVGMLALETLGRRVSEDRPQNKFTRNPSYADDVKWLLNVAKKIGLPYLQNFLMCVMATVVSPYLLQVIFMQICLEVSKINQETWSLLDLNKKWSLNDPYNNNALYKIHGHTLLSSHTRNKNFL